MTLFALPALAAAAYWTLACIAAIRARSRRIPPTSTLPAISVLKAVRGRDPRFYEAIRSHAVQDYPEFELLFGLSDPQDAAIQDIERVASEFPNRRIAWIQTDPTTPNRKVGNLAEILPHARHDVILINDADIAVEPGYLRAVAAALDQPGVGVVTCLYRAAAQSFAGRCEALGIATEFAPSVLVARLLGQVEFALGSTMAFHRDRLAEIGGFGAIQDYIADDYQLGKHIFDRGHRIEFANTTVVTNLGAPTWSEVWKHQLRWSRTVRISRPGGYAGYVVTHATVWAIVAAAGGAWPVALAAFAIRVAGGLLTGLAEIRDAWLIPFRDLLGFAVWLAGLAGRQVDWRGSRLTLRRDGKIHRR